MSDQSVPAFYPWNVLAAPGSPSEQAALTRAGSGQPHGPVPDVIARGIRPSPAHDLRFNGGKTIAGLIFANLYVGGQQAWNSADIQNVDRALAAAMADVRLNNVMAQYFPGQTVTSTALASRVLPGSPPTVMSQGDVESLLSSLFTQNALPTADFSRTVFNFMLPSGTILNTDSAVTGQNAASGATDSTSACEPEAADEQPAQVSIAEDSLNGLGGYHGSIHVSDPSGSRTTLYYAVGAYSEVMQDGRTNGIPAFPAPWKNVVATFYHELQEARTDADVADAIRMGTQSFTGWTSDQGEECGDFPVFEANPLSLVFQEVPLADGNGTVPVQFQYSNAVHGPEGPIATPH